MRMSQTVSGKTGFNPIHIHQAAAINILSRLGGEPMTFLLGHTNSPALNKTFKYGLKSLTTESNRKDKILC
jgi:hypothetical protein